MTDARTLGRDSSVGVVTRLQDGRPCFDIHQVYGFVLFATTCRLSLGTTQPSLQWIPGAISPGVKQPGREANNSPRSSVEIKNTLSYTSTSPYAFMAWYLIKQRIRLHGVVLR
jgi:hypothetical protein